MKKSSWFFAGFLLLLGTGAVDCSKAPLSESDVAVVTENSFENEVVKSNLPVLVDFWATWCGPCRMYGPIVDQLARDYKGRLKVVRVDIDQNPNLTRKFHIQAIPASFLLQKGNIVKTWVGLVSEEDLKGGVDEVVPASSGSVPKS